ncbi:MAG: transglutaminase family protein [Opitutaceae bacterium]
MKLHVVHTLSYRYTAPVVLAPQHILMRPRENHHVSVAGFQLVTTPEMKLFWARDHHENSLAIAHHYDRVEAFAVRAEMEVETLERNPFDFVVRLDAARYPFEYTPAERAMLAPYRDTPDGKARPLLAWMRSALREFPDDTLEMLTQLNQTIREHVDYRTRPEPGVQAPEETIRNRAGTCRDFANLMTHACHALGFAARFVSGYLYDPSSAPDAGEPPGSLHAWTEVYLPGPGWKGFDPTHAILVDDHFIPIAVGRGPANLNPVAGAFWGAKDTRARMETSLEVREI